MPFSKLCAVEAVDMFFINVLSVKKKLQIKSTFGPSRGIIFIDFLLCMKMCLHSASLKYLLFWGAQFRTATLYSMLSVNAQRFMYVANLNSKVV